MGHLSAISRAVVHGTAARLALPAVAAAAAAVAVAGCGVSAHPQVRTPHAAVRPSVTTSAPVQSAAAVSPAATPVIATGPVVRSFSGARSRAIGSLSEKRSLVIRWNVAKPPIQIYTSKGNLLLTSDRRSGAIRLGRGEYRKLRIATNGHWTIQLRAMA
jgi:hypothetical protein